MANTDDGTVAGRSGHESLKYSLLGPSLLKAGQDSVDQAKVSDIIYNASKGSKYFSREEEKDKILSGKIDQILSKKAHLEQLDLSRDLRLVDNLIAKLDHSRDLSRCIVHVDCDAFFAAVEALSQPELAGVPFAVGGGVLSTCNYLARKFGCRSGMAGFVAKKLCPQLVIVKPDFEKYSAMAKEVRQILETYDSRFESTSIDEAYLDITEYCASHGLGPEKAVSQMRKEVVDKTKITVSAGIAANTRLAKICSNINKPDGQYTLENDRQAILDFAKDLPCRKVTGVGRVFERELAAIGIKTCGDIYEHRQFIGQLFGDKACRFLIECYLGLGRTALRPTEAYERKSVGTESTFPRISDPKTLRKQLRLTAALLEKDLERTKCKGRVLVLKVKLDTFEVFTRQVIVPKAIRLADDLYANAEPILAKLELELPGMGIRLLGLRCTNLVQDRKPDTLAFFGVRPFHRANSEPRSMGVVESESSGGLVTDVTGADHSAEVAKLDKSNIAGMRLQYGSSDGTATIHKHQELVLRTSRGKGMECGDGEWWECPVCFRSQQADEVQFNSHVDMCLSRQAILDAVQEHAGEVRGSDYPRRKPETQLNRQRTEKKRGRPVPSRQDPRQKRICFNGSI